MKLRTLVLPEALDRDSAAGIRDQAVLLLEDRPDELVLDLSEVKHADAFGVAALLGAYRARGESRVRLLGVSESLRALFAFLRVDRVLADEEVLPARESFLERLGGWAMRSLDGAVQQAVLNLDGLYFAFVAPFKGGERRTGLFVRQLSEIGARSVGIVTLICFLIGVIMALQGAYLLRKFGANILVANLVGVSLTRELGPLMTAIILAARSGSSIAAEIGTMVVTEEVDALRVMALDPRRYLVAPRFAAMLVAMPCLVILADLAGIAGGFAVGVLGLDLGFGAYWEQTIEALYVKDIVTGLVKAFVFANIISIVACHRGLTLTGGPEEVGRATTRSVVISIIVIILADFAFTTLFYVLD